MRRFFQFWVLLCLAVYSLSAQEVIREVDTSAEPVEEAGGDVVMAADSSILNEEVIPQAYAASRYQNTWNNNPFLRVTAPVAGPKVDWSADWALAGMYKSTTGKISVSLQNKQTGDYKRISNDGAGDSEFRLIKANFNRNRNEASVEVAKGNETATLKYDDNLTSKPVTISNTFKAAGGAQPGSSNVRPGQPVNATPQPGAQPNLQGAVPGAINRPGTIVPAPPTGQASPSSPPTISRRRQLIPAPVVPPAQPQ